MIGTILSISIDAGKGVLKETGNGHAAGIKSPSIALLAGPELDPAGRILLVVLST